MTTTTNKMRAITVLGRLQILEKCVGALMWKCGLSRYFMQSPVDPFDFPLLCFIWRNKLYFYICLPYGHRNSGMHGQKTTTALVYIFENRGKKFDGRIFDALNYSDDVGGVERGIIFEVRRPKFCMVVHIDNTYMLYHAKPNHIKPNHIKPNHIILL